MARTGRPTKFTTQLAKEICRRIAEGESLRAICAADARAIGIPTRPTVYKWLAENLSFQRDYRTARYMQADLFCDDIVEIADARDPGAGEPRDARRDQMRINARRWVATQLAPHRYGERTAMSEGAEEDETVQEEHEDIVAARIAAILEAARARKAKRHES